MDSTIVNNNPSVIEILLGTHTANEILAYMILGLIGALVFIILDVNKGVNNKENGSPAKFSWGYLLKRNLYRIILTPIFCYVWALAGLELVKYFELGGFINEYPFSKAVFILIGFYTDKISKFIQKFRNNKLDLKKIDN